MWIVQQPEVFYKSRLYKSLRYQNAKWLAFFFSIIPGQLLIIYYHYAGMCFNELC